MVTKSGASEPSQELLDVIPAVMREIRSQMRSHTPEVLTVPQFRALGFVNRNSGATLSDLAAHIGLTLPSASRMVEALITRGLMTREEHPLDRRRVKLTVTERGRSLVSASKAETLAFLSEKLAGVGEGDKESVVRAMKVLRKIFPPKPAATVPDSRRRAHKKGRV